MVKIVITNYAREQTALRMGSNVDNLNRPYLAVGSGSGITPVVTVTGLLHYFDRNQANTVSDFATAQELKFTTDFNNTEISGLTLRQFGAFVESSGGKAWIVENVNSVVFDGTNELQVECVFRVF